MGELFSKIGSNIWYAVTFIAGLVVQHLFGLYINKIAKLRYSISKSFLGASGSDNYFGSVQILYNRNPVENLFLYKLNLVNTTNKDFKDLEITLWCDINSTILVSSASKFGTINILSLVDKYIEESKNITTQNEKILRSRRPYIIPVLNRDENVIFSCIVTNENKADPGVFLNCEHPGLKIEPNFIQPEVFWGENKNLAVFYGFFISAFASAFITYYIHSKIIISILAFLLGSFCLIPGIMALKLGEKIRKTLR